MKRSEKDLRFERALARETLEAMNFLAYNWMKAARQIPPKKKES